MVCQREMSLSVKSDWGEAASPVLFPLALLLSSFIAARRATLLALACASLDFTFVSSSKYMVVHSYLVKNQVT